MYSSKNILFYIYLILEMDFINPYMNNNKSISLVLPLVILGIIILVLRIALKSDEAVPAGDTVWQISISATIKQEKNRSDLHMAIPLDSANIRINNMGLEHPDFTLKRIIQKRKNQREIVAAQTTSGEATFTAEYKTHVSETRRWQDTFGKAAVLKPESRLNYLSISSDIDLDDKVLAGLLKKLQSESTNQQSLVENIFELVHQKIISDSSTEYESEENTLKLRRANTLGKAKLMLLLCRASNIPARLVTGIIVREMLDLDEHFWIEVYLDKRWVAYDPTIGFEKDLPPNYLRLNVDSDQVAYLADGTPINVTIDSIQLPTPAGLLGTGEKKLFDILDLKRLPISTQFLLSTLLLLPIGALITSVFRQIIGISTYGTFTPSLLAMAIIHSEWFTVIIVILIVIAVGFGSRSVMPEKMSRVPRLSIILTIVAIGMVFSISIMEYFQLNPNPAAVLLPIIVLTNMVDRFYATTDENGIVSAIYRLIWTFIVTAICFSVFVIELLQQLVLGYPEIHFITLAVILLLSDYKGKKLSSLPYWSWLREPKIGTS